MRGKKARLSPDGMGIVASRGERGKQAKPRVVRWIVNHSSPPKVSVRNVGVPWWVTTAMLLVFSGCTTVVHEGPRHPSPAVIYVAPANHRTSHRDRIHAVPVQSQPRTALSRTGPNPYREGRVGSVQRRRATERSACTGCCARSPSGRSARPAPRKACPCAARAANHPRTTAGRRDLPPSGRARPRPNRAEQPRQAKDREAVSEPPRPRRPVRRNGQSVS